MVDFFLPNVMCILWVALASCTLLSCTEGDKRPRHFFDFVSPDGKNSTRCFSFQIITCDSRTENPHELSGSRSTLLRSTNICRNRIWTGVGMKLQVYSAFALNVSRFTATQKCEPVLIFIDGDVLFNTNRLELQKRWLSIDADVVVSAEMACWVGHDCTLQDFQKFYMKAIDEERNVTKSSSLFVNSGAFMGKATALADILQNSPYYPTFDMGKGYDDQYAVTQMVMNPSRNWTIRRDVTQSIFGSFVYSQYSLCPNQRLGRRISCYDTIDHRFHSKECCSSWDIYIELQKQMFQVVESGSNVCTVVRPSGFTDVDDYVAINRTNISFWDDSFSLLHRVPLFWHGNGPGKEIFLILQKQVEHCRNNL